MSHLRLIWSLVAALLAALLVALALGLAEAPTPRDDDDTRQPSATPQRVLACDAGLVDLLVPLIAPERIVALPGQADTWSCIVIDPEPFARHPRFLRFDAESVIVHEPDLVLASAFSDAAAVARLEALDVPVLRIPVRDTLEDVQRALLEIGAAVGNERGAEALVADLDRRRAQLARATTDRSDLVVVAYSNFGTGGWSFGAVSTIDTIIRLAGMRNGVAELGRKGSTRLSYEELLLIDPDLLLVTEPAPLHPDPTRELLRDDPVLAGLKAVRRRAIVVLPPRLTESSSQEMMTAAERLADAAGSLLRAGRVGQADDDGDR